MFKEKYLKEFLKYLCLIAAVFFINQSLEYYVTIEFAKYSWIALLLTAFFFYLLAKE